MATITTGELTLTQEEFDTLVAEAKRHGGAAARGIEREAGSLTDDDQANAIVRCAGAIAFGRQMSRSFTPQGVELMNRIADEVVRRVSEEIDEQSQGAVH